MAAFIVNLEQSLWQPTKVLTLIDIEVDLNSDTLKISSETSSSVIYHWFCFIKKSYFRKNIIKIGRYTCFNKIHNKNYCKVEKKTALQGNRNTIIFGQKTLYRKI